MAYGKKYEIHYKNRIQKDIYRVEIWEKDFAGDPTELTGADFPFIVEWTSGDTDILTPIKSAEFTISFLNKDLANTYNLEIEDFYSDDDEQFRIDHYFQSLDGGGGTEKLLHSGYLIEDGATEPATDRKHVITLKATDNLALLKNVKWNEIGVDYDGAFALGYYVRYCLEQTGLYASATSIDMSLPLRIFDNLYENTIDDRSDDDVADPYHQIILYSGVFKNNDNTWKSCFEVLETVLRNMNADLIQANGCWNVRRIPEYSLFTDAVVPGTEYVYNGSGTDITEVFLDEDLTIDKNGVQINPIEEDQTKGIQRPLKSVQNTFNYNIQPWIRQSDLKIADGATPFATSTVDGIRYDKYDTSTYFPGWTEIGTPDTTYLEVVTDTNQTPEAEIDRYIVSVFGNAVSGIRFTPVPITKGDMINFSLRFRTDNDVSGDLRFYVLISYIETDCTQISVSAPLGEIAPAEWGPFPGSTPIHLDIDGSTTDTTQWINLDVEVLNPAGHDGMLIIEVYGTNGASDHDDYTTYWKDPQLSISNRVTNSILAIGQTHLDTGASAIKAIEENEIELDDSPRNSIAGTLFTDDITVFCNDIGNVFFTRTALWHRAEIDEALRLGNILTQERIRLKFASRSTMEGTFKNVRYDLYEGEGFISLLNSFEFAFPAYLNKLFVAASMSVNYMACTFKARLIEIFKAGEAQGAIETINLLEANGDETTYTSTGTAQIISFSDIISDTDFTENIAFTTFTYTGTAGTIKLETNVQGIWDSTASATLNLKVNGVSVGSFLVGIGGAFHFFTAYILKTLTLNPGDDIIVTLDWSGSTPYSLEIMDNTYLKASKQVFTGTDVYSFTYLYEQT